jgi:hypothetical protein
MVWATDLDTYNPARVWEKTGGRDCAGGAVLRCDINRDGDWTAGVEVAGDETAWLSCEDPEVAEGLEVTFVVEDGGWEDGIEGAEEHGHC